MAIANTDPDLLLFFKNFLLSFFDVDENRIRINVNCYLSDGLSKFDIEKYWLTKLGLSIQSLRKGTYKVAKNKSIRKNKHKYGVCSLRVDDTSLVQRIFGSIQEYMGFFKPEWLHKG